MSLLFASYAAALIIGKCSWPSDNAQVKGADPPRGHTPCVTLDFNSPLLSGSLANNLNGLLIHIFMFYVSYTVLLQ